MLKKNPYEVYVILFLKYFKRVNPVKMENLDHKGQLDQEEMLVKTVPLELKDHKDRRELLEREELVDHQDQLDFK